MVWATSRRRSSDQRVRGTGGAERVGIADGVEAGDPRAVVFDELDGVQASGRANWSVPPDSGMPDYYRAGRTSPSRAVCRSSRSAGTVKMPASRVKGQMATSSMTMRARAW